MLEEIILNKDDGSLMSHIDSYQIKFDAMQIEVAYAYLAPVSRPVGH